MIIGLPKGTVTSLPITLTHTGQNRAELHVFTSASETTNCLSTYSTTAVHVLKCDKKVKGDHEHPKQRNNESQHALVRA